MKRKAKRWCVWADLLLDGWRLWATFEDLRPASFSAKENADEYAGLVFDEESRVRILPEGKHPGGKP